MGFIFAIPQVRQALGIGGSPPPPPPQQPATGPSASDPLCVLASEGQTITVNPPANGYLKAPTVAWYARNDNFSPENYTQGTCNTYPTYTGAWGTNTYVLDLITGMTHYGRRPVSGQVSRSILYPPLEFGGLRSQQYSGPLSPMVDNCTGPNPSNPACNRTNTLVSSQTDRYKI
jgi:hypothetical protein